MSFRVTRKTGSFGVNWISYFGPQSTAVHNGTLHREGRAEPEAGDQLADCQASSSFAVVRSQRP